MDTIHDFEDVLELLDRFGVRYLIIGGLAFTYHAMPRYTKDIDLWVGPEPENVARTNRALAAFGSSQLLDAGRTDEILQIGVAPNRIDLLREVAGPDFDDAWRRRIEGRYGRSPAQWINLDDLIDIKSRIDHPRHQEDARILGIVREKRTRKD